ncbi:MFS transporter [Cupriavidus necator]|uniref:MFS transporter n=1 Tax=Cupriavidus necator TaxID=106590 RepID=A0A1U9V085_CUPNE|nr:MFS transporter [Cupriavidus necator]AQV98229.1 MFS transporter [Cupriavidus necator]
MKHEAAGVRQHYTLFLLFLVTVINLIDRQVMGVVIEPIKREFHVSDAAMGLLTGLAFSVVYCCCAIPIARHADRANRRNVIAASCTAWSVMTIVCSGVTGYWQLAMARMGVAIGESGSNAPSMSMIADLYPPQRRAKAISVLMLAAPVGTLIGMSVGAYITFYYGWRATFFWLGLPGLAVALLLRATTREPARIDFPGDAKAGAAAAGKQPVGEVLGEILSSRTFVTIVISGALLAFSAYAFGVWSTAFLVRTHGMTLRDAGALMGLAAGPGAVIGSLTSGWLADWLARRDARWQLGVPVIGALLTFPCALAVTLAPVHAAWHLGTLAIPAVGLFFFCMSVFGMWWMAPSYSAVTQLFPGDRRATVIAIYNFGILAVGAGLGPLAVGILSDGLAAQLGSAALGRALATTSLANLVAAGLLATALGSFARALPAAAAVAGGTGTTETKKGTTARA